MIRKGPLKRALITGITGQDGFHLTELLQSKGYKIFGLLNGQRNSRVLEFSNKFPDVEMLEGDLTDFSSLMRAIDISKPDELYNLGAISFVGLSFKQPELTANVTGLGPLRLLEAIRLLKMEKKIKFYQASTSEIFGSYIGEIHWIRAQPGVMLGENGGALQRCHNPQAACTITATFAAVLSLARPRTRRMTDDDVRAEQTHPRTFAKLHHTWTRALAS
jgi:GDP-D-mannose dehydratase